MTAALEEADHCFKALQALDCTGKPKLLGKAMIRYPMSPRHPRFLPTVVEMMRKKNEKNHARPTRMAGSIWRKERRLSSRIWAPKNDDPPRRETKLGPAPKKELGPKERRPAPTSKRETKLGSALRKLGPKKTRARNPKPKGRQGLARHNKPAARGTSSPKDKTKHVPYMQTAAKKTLHTIKLLEAQTFHRILAISGIWPW
ncbi:hypothetical protein SADUNF_Sadunf17G0102100 [Salix dunnii]|uniref:Uncharacterized protein n=1 Tax=Salix dunnii TaxID=1413687 RepID=A0A835MHJ8_9ROSI|nr:hypothetical protein SADUNF_Sadunf17G0102100 [Salix dunnii]